MHFFDVVLEGDTFIFLNETGEICTIVKKEQLEKNTKLVFQVSDYEEAMQDAKFIGKIVFLLVSICAEFKYILIGPGPRSENSAEDQCEFESEFI